MTSEDYRVPLPTIPQSIAAARESLKNRGAKPPRVKNSRPVPDGPREALDHDSVYGETETF